MGPSGWWPADSKTEIIIGAIMIQNTNWRNADRAVANFRKQTAFDPQTICALSTEECQALVKPAGFYKNKSKTVANTFTWLKQWYFDYEKIKSDLGPDLRHDLLNIHGIGDETADVLLTYVFDEPTFIADKYARTLFTHLGITGLSNYQSLAQRCQLGNEFDLAMAQDFHGQIDEFGKQYFGRQDTFINSFLAGAQLKL